MQHKAVSADQFGSFSLCKPAVMFLSLRTLVATLFQTYSDNVLHAIVYSALQEKSKSERMERTSECPLFSHNSLHLFGEDFF